MKVSWSVRALSHLRAIRLYVGRDSVSRADDLCARLIITAGQLTKYPFSGPLLPEDPAYRQLVVDGYRVVYVIAEDSVTIATIIAPGRTYREASGD